MNDWTPPQRIRPIAIALIEHGNHWLMMEVRDRNNTVKGYRPVGGGLEFGETAVDALHREFREEVGWVPTDLELLKVVENHFRHNDVAGHEIVFVFRGNAPEEARDINRHYDFLDGGVTTTVRWMGRKDATAAPLFPIGIEVLMRGR